MKKMTTVALALAGASVAFLANAETSWTKTEWGRVRAIPVSIRNPDFEEGGRGWSIPRNGAVVTNVVRTGAKAVSITTRDPKRDRGLYITQVVPVVGGEEYRASAFVKTENVRAAEIPGHNSVGAAVIIEWVDKKGKWLFASGSYSKSLWGTNDWTKLETGWVIAPPQAGGATIYLALRGTGRAWFDGAALERREAMLTVREPKEGARMANNTPHFAWCFRPGVRSYEVELSQDERFPKGQSRVYAAGGFNEFQLEEPLPPGTWYWRVNGKGTKESGFRTFVQTAPIEKDCLPPLLKTPAARVTAANEPFTVLVKDAAGAPAHPAVSFEGIPASFVGAKEGGLLEYRFAPPQIGWKKGLTEGVIVCTDASGNRSDKRFWLLNAPKPANDTVINKEGNFAVSGKRYFPLGIYEVAPKYMLEVRRAGFDTVHTYRWEGSQDDAACTKYLDACWQAEGLRAFVGFDRRSIVRGELGHIARRTGALAAHPALFCWYLFDEPEILNQFVTPDQLTACANLIRILDPYHVVVMTTWNVTMNEYRDTWDTHWSQAYGDPASVVKLLAEHRKYLKDVPSPITLLVNCNDGKFSGMLRSGLKPDPEKFGKNYDYLRACAFLGIVKECNGVWWWWFARDDRAFYSASKAPKAWANLVSIVKELGDLRPLVDAAGKVQTGTVAAEGGKVEWWAKTVNGRTTLIAVNTAAKPLKATVNVPGFAAQALDFRAHEVKILSL